MKLLKPNNSEKRNEVASTAKIAFWYTVSNFLIRGLAAISMPIFTRILSKAEVGDYSNYTTWLGILTIIVTSNLYSSIARAKYDFDEEMDEYLSSILILSNIITLITYGIVEFNAAFFVDFFEMPLIYIRILFAYMLFSPAFDFLQTKHRIYRKYKFFIFFSMLSSVVNLGISITFVLLMDDKFMGRVLGTVVPMTIINFTLWAYILFRGRKVSFVHWKYGLIISGPLIFHALSGILLNSSDRIMIKKICGAEDTAIYTVAYTVASLVQLLWMSMNQAWSPWLFDNIHAGNREEIRKRTRIYLVLFTVITIAILLVIPEVVLIFGGREYYEARFVMPPVIVGIVFQFVYSLYVNLETYMKKTYAISIGTVGATTINIALNAIFIPKFGYIAAAYTTLIGFAALMIFHYIIVWKTKEFRGLYDDKFNFIVLGIVFIFHFLCMFLYQNSLIRYLTMLLYGIALCVFAYKTRDKLMLLVKSIIRR